MKYLSALLAVALLITVSSLADAKPKKPKAVERLDIDPVLQGVWYVHMTSTDGGKKTKAVNPPEPLCKVGASKVTMRGGDTYRVTKVLITETKKGEAANIIFFNNTAVWAVTKVPGEPYYLAQAFVKEKEVMRFLVSVR